MLGSGHCLPLAKLPNLVALMIYLVLVPILVFFFEDKNLLLNWVQSLLPERRPYCIVALGNESADCKLYSR